MAKPNLPNRAAEDTVFENLGLDRADLGLTDDQDTGSGYEDEQGSGQDGDVYSPDDSGQDDQGDQSRVSHTREQVDQTRERPTPRPMPRRAEVKADKKGNLVSPDGTIVARAGKEARLYQDLHRTRGQAQTLQGQVNDANQRLQRAVEIGQGFHRELQTLKANQEAIKQFGLDQTEHLSALRLFRELKDNPQQAIKNILTRAAANGINIAELGGANGGVDPKSLVDLIRQELGTALTPLKERTETERQQAERTRQEQEAQTKIQAEVNTFFSQNPEAQEYLPVFTQTLQRYPGMTLGEVWARIQLHFERNPQQRRSQNSRDNSRRSLPAGRQSPPNGGATDMAPVSESYESIIRDVMDKAGFAR